MMRAVLASDALLLAIPAYGQFDYQRLPRDVAHEHTATPGVIFGSRVVIEDLPCCRASAPGAGPDAAELSIAPHMASRDGTDLKLRLDGGRSLKITDCSDQPSDYPQCSGLSFHVHRLIGWWPKYRYYVVQVKLYVAAPPILSPDERYAIAWDSSLLNGPQMELLDLAPPDKLKIYDITSQITCAGRSGSPLPGDNPTWLSNARIAFDDSQFVPPDSRRFRMTLTILAELNLLWRCEF
jgi:hypothetical protein